MPAAAVIPAPKAYIKIVAVKKLVVGYLVSDSVLDSQNFLEVQALLDLPYRFSSPCLHMVWKAYYFEKMRVNKADV